MSRNIERPLSPTGYEELKRVKNSTAQTVNAETDQLCEESKNMHIHHCLSEDRHSADVQVGLSGQIEELYRGHYQVKVESAHSSYVTAQPQILTKSIQEPMVDMSKHMNVDCQKIGSLEQTVEAQDGPVSNTFRANRIDTLNQTNNISTVSNRHDIQIDYCPAPVREFTGRQKELEELKKMFEDHQVIAVVGMGGVGKSQLARKYGELNKNTYQYRFWIEADTTDQLNTSLQELADKLDVKAITMSVLVNGIYQAFTKGRALLIFDNVVRPKDVYDYLPTRFQLADVKVNVLITSIWTDWTTVREVSMVLHPFEAEVSLDFLQKMIENESVHTDGESWMELGNTVGHLPLALRLSSSFIRKQQKYNLEFTIQDYIIDFTTRTDKLLKKTTLDYDNDRSIYVTTIMTLDKLGENAMKLVNVAAYFNPDNILKLDLAPLIPKASDLSETLDDVLNYSLFHHEGTDRFSMHRLIQTSIQLYQQEKKKEKKHYSLTLEYALLNPYSKQYDIVFAYANRYTEIIVQNYKKKKAHRHVILKYLLRNKCTDALKIIFKNFQDDTGKYDAIYLELGSQCSDMFIFILGCLTSTPHKQDLSNKLFQIACEKDNKSIVQFLLGNRLISVTELYHHNQTLLHRAAACASSLIVSLILELNKDVINAQDTRGDTALHVVIELYNKKPKSQIIETARILIDNGASIVITSGAGDTPLHYAILSKAVELVSLISQSDNTVVNKVDNDGRTALHDLCIYYPDILNERVIDIARVLIENGASIVMRDKYGCTALHYATFNKVVELVSLISQSDKTVVNMVDNDGRTALHHLCRYYPDILNEWVIDIARVLIENGASIVMRDKYGCTPLHFAIFNKVVELISLISQSDNTIVNMVDNDGRTALHRLCMHYPDRSEERVFDIAHVLIKNGASVIIRDRDGCTALHGAASYTHAQLVSVLIQSNKQVIDMVDNRRNTALHWVARNYTGTNTECVEQTISILITNGLSIHTLNIDDRSPMETIPKQYKKLLSRLAHEHQITQL